MVTKPVQGKDVELKAVSDSLSNGLLLLKEPVEDNKVVSVPVLKEDMEALQERLDIVFEAANHDKVVVNEDETRMVPWVTNMNGVTLEITSKFEEGKTHILKRELVKKGKIAYNYRQQFSNPLVNHQG